MVRTHMSGLAGIVVVVALWWLALTLVAGPDSLAAQFLSTRALAALPSPVREDRLFEHIVTSLRRIAVGLVWALLIGVPLGFLIGRLRWLDAAMSPALRFLRMIFRFHGCRLRDVARRGRPAVYFLLTFAALCPLVMSTAAGVAQIDRRWLQLGESLAATRFEMLWHVYVPGIAVQVLTGVRLSIGILWIVLVPAQMLGSERGLGYLVLDSCDRLACSELTAVILVIGALGLLLDYAARLAYRRFGAG